MLLKDTTLLFPFRKRHNKDKDAIQLKATMLYDVFCEFGLEINIEKTETMIWNWNTEEDGDYPKSIITINKIPPIK